MLALGSSENLAIVSGRVLREILRFTQDDRDG